MSEQAEVTLSSDFISVVEITVLCIVAAAVYGICHDEITIRVCPEYFTLYHPFLLETQSLTVLAMAWGMVATWWVGLPLGVLLGISARAGRSRKMTALELVPWIASLLVVMAVCALSAGAYGWFAGTLIPPDLHGRSLPPGIRNFEADSYAHLASYASGILGGVVTCALVLRRRWRSRDTASLQ